MRVLAIILAIVATIAGFTFSYGYTYKKVSGYLYSSPDMQLSVTTANQQQNK